MDRVDPETRSRIMARVRSVHTKPELAVRKALHAIGMRYRLHVKSLPGKPDVVVPSRKLAIFIHGCFWHGCPRCSSRKRAKSNLAYWREKIERNRARDRAALQLLRRNGWRVRVLWECDIRNPSKVAMFVSRVAGLPSVKR
jgi:DNA mismatch endonuclease (patch repair protein)